MNLTKALGLRWRQLTEEDRKLYQDMFREQLTQYDLKLQQYLNLTRYLTLNQNLKESVAIPTDAPKHPVHPFFVFCEMEDARISQPRTPEDEEKDYYLISLSYGQRWRQMSQESKEG